MKSQIALNRLTDGKEYFLIVDTESLIIEITEIKAYGDNSAFKKDNYSSLLVVFLWEPESFCKRIEKKLMELGFSKRVDELIPISEAIAFVLKNKMDYWVEKSIPWLTYIPISENLKSEISEYVSDIRRPQENRHKLKKLVIN